MTAIARLPREDLNSARATFRPADRVEPLVANMDDAPWPNGDVVDQSYQAPSGPCDDFGSCLDPVERAAFRIGEIDADILKRRRRFGFLARMTRFGEPGRLADPALEALRRLVIDLRDDRRGAHASVMKAVAAGVRPAAAALVEAACRATAEPGMRGRPS